MHVDTRKKGKGKGTVKHNRARLLDYTDITRLLLEFSHGALLGCFALIDQTGRYFDGDFVDGRSELFL